MTGLVHFTVSRWFAEKEGFDTVDLEGFIRRETEKAYLIEMVDGGEYWIPKRVMEFTYDN